MKLTRSIRLTLAVASLACAATSPAQVVPATPVPVPTTPIEAKTSAIPVLSIGAGPLVGAVDQLSETLRGKGLPAINVIYTPEARLIQVPEMTLQNVTGPDALRLIAVGAGCDLEDIVGADARAIGYRVFPVPRPASPFGGFDPTGAPGTPGIPANPPNQFAQPAPGTAPIPGAGGPGSGGFPGSEGASGGVPQNFINFVGMPGANPNAVRVYSLGSITNTTKFNDVEKSLRDVLQTGGVSSEAAKLAFHERTNVLVVTADYRVQELVTQYLDALQKNVAAAAAEDKRSGGDRREAVEALIRLNAERDQRQMLMKQLEEAEAKLRETQRELDRVKTGAPKAH